MKGISYTLNLDSAPMLRSLRSALSSVGSFAAQMGKTPVRINTEPLLKSLHAARAALSGMASAAGKVGGLTGLAGGLISTATGATAFKKAINEAAQMEGFQTSFKVLLGSADAAKKRLTTLSKFAADTPFELPEVVQASRQLQVMTDGALATGAGLTLVGDVASGTQAPFEELAMWIGRLYAGLKGGQPVGEAMMRLQELGAVGARTGQRLEEMQQSGASFNEIWTVAGGELTRFSGMMSEQSKTWNGLFSTLNDGVNQLFRSFGEPLMNTLKPILDEAIGLAEKAIPLADAWGKNAAEAVRTMRDLFTAGTFGEAAGLTLKIAFADARNFLIESLADGIVALQPQFTAIGDGLGMKMNGFALEFGAVLKDAIADAMTAIPGLAKGGKALRASAQHDSDRAAALSAAGDQEIGKAGGIASMMRALDLGGQQIAADRARLEALVGGAAVERIHAPMDEALRDPQSVFSNMMRAAGGAVLIGGQNDQRAAEATARHTGMLTQLIGALLEETRGQKAPVVGRF